MTVSPRGSSGAIPSAAAGQFDGRRETGIDIEHLDVVDTDPAPTGSQRSGREGGAPGGRDGGRATRIGTGRREPHVGGVRPRPHEDRPIRDPGPPRRGQGADQEGRSLVGPEVGAHALGIGIAHETVVGRRGGDGLGGPGLTEPCVGVGRGNLGERGQQPAHGESVPGAVVAGAGRHHALEEGVDVHRDEQPDRHLCRADPREVVPHHRIGGSSVRPGSAGIPAARLARDDRMASAPAIKVTERAPPAMAEAARLTSHCGLLPPTVVTSSAPGRVPSRSASSVAGAGPERDMMSTTDRRSIRSRRAGAEASASSAARAIRSTGVTSSVRSMD